MNNKQKKILESIFKKPTPSNINWNDIIKLFKTLDAVVIERDGSRVFVKLNDCRIVLHAPHPVKETDKGAVNDIRIFLERAGVTP